MTEEIEKTIEDMNKDELEAFVLANFNVNLDKRRNINDLRMQAAALMEGTAPPTPVVADVEVVRPKMLRHKTTGHIWDWNPAYANNPDLEPHFEE